MSDRLGLVDLLAPLPHVQFVDMGLGQGVGPAERVGNGSVAVAVAMVIVEWLAQRAVCVLGGRGFVRMCFWTCCVVVFRFVLAFRRFSCWKGIGEVPRGLLSPLLLGILGR